MLAAEPAYYSMDIQRSRAVPSEARATAPTALTNSEWSGIRCWNFRLCHRRIWSASRSSGSTRYLHLREFDSGYSRSIVELPHRCGCIRAGPPNPIGLTILRPAKFKRKSGVGIRNCEPIYGPAICRTQLPIRSPSGCWVHARAVVAVAGTRHWSCTGLANAWHGWGDYAQAQGKCADCTRRRMFILDPFVGFVFRPRFCYRPQRTTLFVHLGGPGVPPNTLVTGVSSSGRFACSIRVISHTV